MKKSKGGKRLGSGRKKADYETKTIAFRVREEWVNIVKLAVKEKVTELKKNNLKNNTPTDANNVLCAGQFTCDKCQLKKRYSTGADEYPAYTTIEYCSKGHWECGDIPSADDIDNWSKCVDFSPCT